MKIQDNLGVLKHFLRNTKSMLTIAWQMDNKLTVLYYGVAAISAIVPAVAGLTMKYLIDNLQLSQRLGVTTLPLILITILATRYTIVLFGDILRNVIYGGYCNYIFRYKLQNHLTFLFYSKLAGLDIPYLEDPESQNLIAKARDTVSWRVPDFLRALSHFFESIVSLIQP